MSWSGKSDRDSATHTPPSRRRAASTTTHESTPAGYIQKERKKQKQTLGLKLKQSRNYPQSTTRVFIVYCFNVQNARKNIDLTYFWRTSSSGFAKRCTHQAFQRLIVGQIACIGLLSREKSTRKFINSNTGRH